MGPAAGESGQRRCDVRLQAGDAMCEGDEEKG
jgi:hypothetical protein